MRIPTALLRAVVVGPKLVLSAALVLVLLALLPTVLAWTVLVLMVVILGAAASGAVERAAVQLLQRARPAEEAYRRWVSDAVMRTRGARARRTAVYVRRGGPYRGDLALVGRGPHVLMPPLAGSTSSPVTDGVHDQLVARASAPARVDDGAATRVRLATFPDLLLAAVIAAPLVRLRGTRLGAAAWRLRGVMLVGLLSPASSSPHGAATVGAATLVGLTYVVPLAERELMRRQSLRSWSRLSYLLREAGGSASRWRRRSWLVLDRPADMGPQRPI